MKKKKESSSQYIDVWDSIEKTSKKFTPLEVFALLATRAYGHSLRQISKILQITPTEVKKIIRKMERAIKADLKSKGANLKNLTNLHGVEHILEVEKDDDNSMDGDY